MHGPSMRQNCDAEGLLCISLPGKMCFRWLSNPSLFTLHASLETDCIVSLCWFGSNRFLPVIHRDHSITNAQPVHGSRTLRCADCPLLCFSLQFPYDIHDITVPVVCHAFLASFRVLISPELVDWFRTVTPSASVSSSLPLVADGECASGDGHSKHRELASKFDPIAYPTVPMWQPNATTICSGSHSNRSFGFFTNSVCSRRDVSKSIDTQSIWPSWRQCCMLFYRLLGRTSFEVLLSAIRLTICTTDCSVISESTGNCDGRFGNVHSLNSSGALHVHWPEIRVSSSLPVFSDDNRSELTFFDGSCARWSTAIRLLPLVEYLTEYFPVSKCPNQWALRASKASLLLYAQPLVSLNVLMTLTVNPDPSSSDTSLEGTLTSTALNFCLHVRIISTEAERNVDTIVSLNHLFSAMETFRFFLESLKIIQNSTIFGKPTNIPLSQALGTRSFSESPADSVCRNSGFRGYRSCSGSTYSSASIMNNSSTIVICSPTCDLRLSSNIPPVSFWIQLSAPRMSGQFTFDSDCIPSATVRLTLKGAVATFDLQEHLTIASINIDSVIAVLCHQNGRVVPLFCPMESALRTFDLCENHPISLVTGSPVPCPQPQAFDVSNVLFTNLSHLCTSDIPTEPSTKERAIFRMEYCQFRGGLDDGVPESPCFSIRSNPDKSNMRTSLRAVLRSFDLVLFPELLEQISALYSSTFHSPSPLTASSSVTYATLSSTCAHHLSTVQAFRIFIPLCKIPFDVRTDQSVFQLNTLVLCCDFLEAKTMPAHEPSVESNAQSTSSDSMLSTIRWPNVQASKFTIAANGFRFWASDFSSVLLPEEFVCRIAADHPGSDVNSVADLQNPARYWNRGLLRASWNCLPHPAPGWLLIPSLFWILSYGSVEPRTAPANVCSLGLFVNNDLLIFLDSSVMDALLLSCDLYATRVNIPAAANSRTSPGYFASMFDRFFCPIPGATSTHFEARMGHVRLICWNLKISGMTQLVVDVSEPWMVIRFGTATPSDSLEFGIEDLQVDGRVIQSGIDYTSVLSRNWIRFIPHCPRNYYSSPPLILLPVYPIPENPLKPDSQLFLSFRTKSLKMKSEPLVVLQVSHSSIPFSIFHHPRVRSDHLGWTGAYFQCSININRDVFIVVNPQSVDLLSPIAWIANSATQVAPGASDLNPKITSDYFSWFLSRFSNSSVGCGLIKLTMLFQSVGIGTYDCLSLEIRRAHLDSLVRSQSMAASGRLKWRLELSGLTFSCNAQVNTENVVCDRMSYAHQYTNYRAILLWLHPLITVAGSLRFSSCSHRLVDEQPMCYFNDLDISVCMSPGCQIDLPVSGPTFDALQNIVSFFYLALSGKTPPLDNANSPLCEECSSLQPDLSFDDLRQEIIGFNVRDTIERVFVESNPSDSVFIYPTLACWPWLKDTDSIDQLPLATHPWPRMGEYCFCDNFQRKYYSSVSATPTDLLFLSNTVENHWVGFTWAYPEPRTPVRIRLLPVPFSFPNLNSEAISPDDLELCCMLQYWDHSTLPSGAFRTYALFSLRSSQIMNFVLIKQRSGRTSTNYWSRLDSELTVLTRSNVTDCSSTPPADHLEFEGSTSESNWTQPFANVWRVVVDLRARVISDNSSSSTPTDNISDAPITLVHISPMALAGSIILDSVHSDSHSWMKVKRIRLHFPSLFLFFLEQAYARKNSTFAGMELARLEFFDFSATYNQNISEQSLHGDLSSAIELNFSRCDLLTADPNWASLQLVLQMEHLAAYYVLGSHNIQNEMSCQLGNTHLFVGTDRLIGLSKFSHIIHLIIGESNRSLEVGHTGNLSDVSFEAQWRVINLSNHKIILQQLGLDGSVHCDSWKRAVRNLDVSSPFNLSILPQDSVLWRPLLPPGRLKNFSQSSWVRLRFGVHSRSNSGLVLSEPVETTWPPHSSTARSPDLSAVNLTWITETNNENLFLPTVFVIFQISDPIGAPSRIILHSDFILRNLLPVELDCVVSSATCDLSGQNEYSPEEFTRLALAPSEVFVSSLTPPSGFGGSRNIHRLLKFRFGMADVDSLDEHWSDAFHFSVPSMQKSNQKLCTSQRTLIRIPPIQLDAERMFPLYAVLTLEFRSLSSLASALTVVTLAPIFEVINRLPHSFRLQTQPLLPYSMDYSTVVTSSTGSPWSETIPAAWSQENQGDFVLHVTKPDDPLAFLPEIRFVPHTVFRAPNLLVTTATENGSSVLPEPVYLSADTVLTKLTSTFLAHRFGSSSSADYSQVKAGSYLIVQTMDMQLPSFIPTSRIHCSHYTVDDGERLCYSLQIVVHPNVRLFNISGLNLVCKLSSDDPENVSEEISCSLSHQAVLVPTKTFPIITLGYRTYDETYWAHTKLQLPGEIFATSDKNNIQQKIFKKSPNFRCEITDSNTFNQLRNEISAESTGRISQNFQLQVLSDDHAIVLTIRTPQHLICLVSRLITTNEHSSNKFGSPAYVICVDSLVHARLTCAMNFHIKTCIVPLNCPVENLAEPISFSNFGNSVTVPGSLAGTTIRLPLWALPHALLSGDGDIQSTGCLTLSISCDLTSSWSFPFVLGALDDLPNRSGSIRQAQLLSLPVTTAGFSSLPLVAALLDAVEPNFVVNFFEVPCGFPGSPVALRVMNRSFWDIAVTVHDPSCPPYEQQILEIWQRLFFDALPVLAANMGCYRWIPASLLRSLCFASASPQSAIPFLDSSTLSQYQLSFRVESTTDCHAFKMDMITFSVNCSSDFGSTFTKVFECAIKDDSILVAHFDNTTSLGPHLVFSANHSSICEPETSLSNPKPVLAMSLDCTQLSVSLLLYHPTLNAVEKLREHSFDYECFSPPHDELVRIVVKDFNLCLSRWSQTGCKKLDVKACFGHLQVDNWAQGYVGSYDFPVVLRSIGTTVLCSRIEGLEDTPVSLVSSVFSVFIYPASLECNIEDNLFRTLSALFSDYSTIFSSRYFSHSLSSSVITDDITQSLCFRCFHIASFDIKLSLRVTLRLYLSCRDAPLSFSYFDLRSNEISSQPPGFVLTRDSLFHQFSVHYFTQALFRAGWVIGSLDMLGNITGLVRSIASGIHDLVFLQPFSNPGKSSHNASSLTQRSNRSNSASVCLNIDGTTDVVHLFTGNYSRPNDPTHCLNSVSFPAIWSRIFGGLNSLSRNTIGGVLRSVTGMATSMARNLDYLALDTQHREFQEFIRRRQPRGLSDGLLSGLSGFGISLLSAVAGITDHPLQALFNAVSNKDSSLTHQQEPNSEAHFVIVALSSLGRGLVGAVVKPVAGIAELVAHTGNGILHGSELDFTANSADRIGGSYTTWFADQLTRYLSVDSLSLRTWAYIALKQLASKSETDCQRLESSSLSPCCITTARVEHSDGQTDIFWLAASSAPILACTCIFSVNTGRISISELTMGDLIAYSTNERSQIQCHPVISADMIARLKCSSVMPLECDRAMENGSSHQSYDEMPDPNVRVPSPPLLSRWQRVKEYLVSTKSGELISL